VTQFLICSGYSPAQKLFLKMNVETKNNVEIVMAWIDSEEGRALITFFFVYHS
jgi:hypothetical protein